MEQLFFGQKELATRYNCHVITISRWVKCGRLPEPEQQGPAKGKFDIRKVELFENSKSTIEANSRKEIIDTIFSEKALSAFNKIFNADTSTANEKASSELQEKLQND